MNNNYSVNGCSIKKRVFSFIIDCFIGFLFMVTLSVSLLLFEFLVAEIFSLPVESPIFITIAEVVAILSYFSYFIFCDFVLKCGSIGKKLVGIKVIDIETQKKPKALRLIISSLLFMLFGVVNFIVMRSSLNRQALSDIITSTVVIDNRNKTGDGGVS